MPLGTEVGFGPGHIVLDADPAPFQTRKPHKGADGHRRHMHGLLRPTCNYNHKLLDAGSAEKKNPVQFSAISGTSEAP